MATKKTKKDVVVTTTVAPEMMATTTMPPGCEGCAEKEKEIARLKSMLKSANGKIGHLTQIIEKQDAAAKNYQESLSSALAENDELKGKVTYLTKTVDDGKQKLVAVMDELDVVKANIERFLGLGTLSRMMTARSAKNLAAQLLAGE